MEEMMIQKALIPKTPGLKTDKKYIRTLFQ